MASGSLVLQAPRTRILSVGDFVLINAYLLQLYVPIQVWATVYAGVRQASADAGLMINLLSVRPTVVDRPGARPIAIHHGLVCFENVSFAYGDRPPALRNISFEIPPGCRVALVGPSGSGKSTISRLLFRFYDVDEGRITIDGQDLRNVTQESLRKAIGVIPQDTVLLNDTAARNLAFGDPVATDAQILAAARAAQIHETFARLPDGYETIVGERGLKLSGGEKQRLAIARVLLKSPPILILDEATSALDTRTERRIAANLDWLTSNRSTLVIAHRLSTIADADQILVLVDGVIAERGRHDDLLQAGGVYAGMWREQLLDH